MQIDFTFAKQYQTFKSKEALNQAVKHFRYEYGHIISENANRILDLLSRYSVKILGVSWLERKTIAKKLGISPGTVSTSIKKLEDLGIVQRIYQFDTNRNGAQRQNLYVIRPFVSERLQNRNRRGEQKGGTTRGVPPETPHHERDQATSNDAETQFSNSIISDRNNIRSNVENDNLYDQVLDSSFVPDHIPHEFVDMVARYFNDAVKISKLWGLVESAFKKYKLEVDPGMAAKAYKYSLFAMKNGKIREEGEEGFDKFFWGVIHNWARELYDTEKKMEELNKKYGWEESTYEYDPKRAMNIWGNIDDSEDTLFEFEKREKAHKELVETFERKFSRHFTHDEKNLLRQWLINYSVELIHCALKEAVLFGQLSISCIESILFEWKENEIQTTEEALRYQLEKRWRHAN